MRSIIEQVNVAKILNLGNPDCVRDFCYIKDHANNRKMMSSMEKGCLQC